jgi:hypothetical protein
LRPQYSPVLLKAKRAQTLAPLATRSDAALMPGSCSLPRAKFSQEYRGAAAIAHFARGRFWHRSCEINKKTRRWRAHAMIHRGGR